MSYFLLLLIFLFSANDFVKPQALELGVTINPYGKTPLSGIFKLAKINDEPLTITVLGKQKNASLSHTFSSQYGHEFPIQGFYNNRTNQLLIFLGDKRILNTNIFISNVYTEQAKKYPKISLTRPKVHVDQLKPSDPFNQDFYFLYDNYTNIVAYDRAGDLRYIYQKDNNIHAMARIELNDGDFYFYFVDKKMIKVNLLGQEHFFPTGNIQVHHDFSYKGEDKIILALSKRGGLEDRLIQVTPKGKVVRDLIFGDLFRNTLDPEDWEELKKTVYDTNNMSSNRITTKEENTDWAHANSMVYDEDNDIIYLSLRHLGVIAVNYSEWTILWWLADNKMNTQQGKTYGFVPADFVYLDQIKSLKAYRLISSTYPRNQHSLLLRSNGNLLMFDNQGDHNINFFGSRVLEYQITLNSNKQGGQAKIVKNIKHPKRVYSRLLSDVDLVGTNHENLLVLWGFDTLLNVFQTTRLAEFDANGRLVFDMSLRTEWIYRVEKKPLYPYQDKNKKYSIDVLQKGLSNF